MKCDKQKTFSVARATRTIESHLIGTGFLNGLLILTPFLLFEDKISVRLRTKKGTISLAENIKLLFLQEYSNMKYGFFGRDGASDVLVDFTTYLESVGVLTGAQQDTIEGQLQDGNWRGALQNAILIDLGAISLDSDYELEYELDFESDGAAAARYSGDVEVYAYSVNRRPVPVKTYEISNDVERNVNSTNAVFIVPRNYDDEASAERLGVDVTTADIQVKDQKTGRSDLMTLKASLALTAAFNRYENVHGGLMSQIFENQKPTPANMYIKITGADSANCSLFIESSEIVEDMISETTIKNAEELVDDISDLERKDNHAAKELRHAAIIEKSTDLQRKINAVK